MSQECVREGLIPHNRKRSRTSQNKREEKKKEKRREREPIYFFSSRSSSSRWWWFSFFSFLSIDALTSGIDRPSKPRERKSERQSDRKRKKESCSLQCSSLVWLRRFFSWQTKAAVLFAFFSLLVLSLHRRDWHSNLASESLLLRLVNLDFLLSFLPQVYVHPKKRELQPEKDLFLSLAFLFPRRHLHLTQKLSTVVCLSLTSVFLSFIWLRWACNCALR